MFWIEWRKILILLIVAPLAVNVAWLLICVIFSIIVEIWKQIKSKYKDVRSWSKWKLKNRIEILESEIKKLEEEKEWSNAIIDDYIGYTWILPREIADKLEKRNKRKKRS